MIAITVGLLGACYPTLPQSSGPSALHAHVEACESGIATLEALRSHLAPPRHRMQVTLSVDSVQMTHGPRPDSRRRDQVTQTLRVFELQAAGEDAPTWRIDIERPDAAVRVNDAFVIFDRTRGQVGPVYGADALREQILSRAAFPATLVRYVQSAGQVLGATSAPSGGSDVLVELEGGRAVIKTVPVSYEVDGMQVEVPGLLGVEWMTHDSLLGDVVEALHYDGEPGAAPGVVSGWEVRGPLGTSETAKVESVLLDSKELPFPGGIYPSPERAGRPLTQSAPEVELRQLGKGTFELLIADEASRSVGVDLGRGWAVLEAPVSTEVGDAIIKALEEEKPGHPFLYVAASHHHPHYIGGMRPFVHRGATVVCPAEVMDYVRNIIERPRTLRPDELSISRREPRMVGVERGERWAPPTSSSRLVVVEVDGHSNHTDAFMLFFLPEERIAFGGDILWIADYDKPRGPNPRTRGLAKILSDADDLGAVEFLTSWPAGGKPLGGNVWLDRAPVQQIADAK
jgi:glyoxylase-like metal-dependent hydrolase (beta-lactamase superfamily II)